jgi:shikimate dehydrogenase
MTSKFCVVGSPIKHSLSPVIHKAAYSHLGLDFCYERVEVLPGGLRAVMDDQTISGLSVTMPLKYEAFDLSDSHSPEALKTGVVNTLLRSPNGWVGHNTDVLGFAKCFNQFPDSQRITIVGSGATARSAALTISRVFPAAKVSVVGRTASSLVEFIGYLKSLGISSEVLEPEASSLVDADLVVSTVPAGAFIELWDQLGATTSANHGLLFDVAYDPWPSMASRAWAGKTISGLELLIWQAIEQVKLFVVSTGHSVPIVDQELYESMIGAVADQSRSK